MGSGERAGKRVSFNPQLYYASRIHNNGGKRYRNTLLMHKQEYALRLGRRGANRFPLAEPFGMWAANSCSLAPFCITKITIEIIRA